MIPVVETERLVLRGMGKADFAAYVAIWQEPEVVRFTGGSPRPVADCWDRFLKLAGNWAIEGFGQWGVFRKADGALVGQVGFFSAMRGLGADFDAAPEAGWVLSAAAHGQGHGSEAAAAAHRWFDAQPFGGVSHAMIEAGHGASFAVAARLGYVPMRAADYEGAQVTLLCRKVRGRG